MGIQERKEREKEQRRQAILDAAESIFFLKGWKVATMDEVAGEAELSKGTLYLYYKNKDELFLAINYRGIKILVDHFEKAISSTGSGLEKVFAIGRAYYRFAQEYPDYYNMLSYFELNELEFHEPEDANSLACKCSELGNSALGVVVKAIQAGIEDGSIRADIDAVRVATILWGQATGIIQLAMHKGKHLQEAHGINMEGIVEEAWTLIRCAIENKAH